jgi:hypothetical protein
MASIKVSPGNRVTIKSTGNFGVVKELVPLRLPGQRGRPKTYATVVLEDGSGEGSYGIPELKLV